MRLIGNIIWFIFGGLVTGLILLLAGVILHITIIGIPFGRQCFKLAKLAFAPFGKVVHTNFGRHPIANVLWLIFFGWELLLYYVVLGIVCCITIIGIPIGLQLFKLGVLLFIPFGADVKRK